MSRLTELAKASQPYMKYLFIVAATQLWNIPHDASIVHIPFSFEKFFKEHTFVHVVLCAWRAMCGRQLSTGEKGQATLARDVSMTNISVIRCFRNTHVFQVVFNPAKHPL